LTASRPSARRIALVLGGLLLAVAWAFAFSALWKTSVPSDLQLPKVDPTSMFSASLLAKARNYETFLRIDELLALLAQLAALAWFAIKGPGFIRQSAAGRIGTGMMLGMLALGVVWLAQLPFGLAGIWWERDHGVARVGYLDWLVSDFLDAGGGFVFISLALLIVMALAGLWRRRWWMAAVPALVAVGFVFAFAQPYLIADLVPVRDPALANSASEIAAREGVSGTNVRIQRVRAFTDAPNAEAVGVGPSRRVILWDTLVEDFPRNEVDFVLAHEFAHQAKSHVLKSLAFSGLLLIIAGLAAELATRRRGGIYEPAAVPLAVFVVALVLALLSPLQAAFSRRLETEADWTALQVTQRPDSDIGFLRGATSRSLTDPDPSGWLSFLDDHPSALHRIEMAVAWAQQRAQ
jgi:STE24 endopeptidase